jgi:hypothetical protein
MIPDPANSALVATFKETLIYLSSREGGDPGD